MLFALQLSCKTAAILCNAFIFYASFAICPILRNHSLRISVPQKTITGKSRETANTTEDLWQRKNQSFSVGWKLDILN
jgi:hypothetical protein